MKKLVCLVVAPLLWAQVFACGEKGASASLETAPVANVSVKSCATACPNAKNSNAANTSEGMPAVLATLKTAGPSCPAGCNGGSVAMATAISFAVVFGSVMAFKKMKI